MVIHTSNWEAESEFWFMLQNVQSWEDSKNGTIDGLFDDYRSGASVISDSLRNKTTRILELWCGRGEYLNMLSEKWFRNLVWIDIRPRQKHDFSTKEIEVIQQDFNNIDNLSRLHWKFDLVYSKLIFDSQRYKSELCRWSIESAHKLLRTWWLYYCLWPHDLYDATVDIRSIVPRQHTLLQWAMNYIPPEA